jgi:hypothetical protein
LRSISRIAGNPTPGQLLSRNLRDRVHDVGMRSGGRCHTDGSQKMMIDKGCDLAW